MRAGVSSSQRIVQTLRVFPSQPGAGVCVQPQLVRIRRRQAVQLPANRHARSPELDGDELQVVLKIATCGREGYATSSRQRRFTSAFRAGAARRGRRSGLVVNDLPRGRCWLLANETGKGSSSQSVYGECWPSMGCMKNAARALPALSQKALCCMCSR